jgi:uncharacterized protein (TIGR02646 family)
MRGFRFAGFVPPTLGPGGKAGQQAARHAALKEIDGEAELQFPEHWNEADVRGVLYAQQGPVCGYCGCHLPRNDRGDVEHFRPKSKYWQRAYAHRNYLLSCSPCNRTRKRAKFPLRDEEQDLPLLFHPGEEPVEDLVRVTIEDGSCRMVARAPSSRVDKVSEFFSWNVDPLLVMERRRCLRDAKAAMERGDEDPLRKMASRFARHSLVTIALLEITNRAALIPSESEDLRAYVEDRLELLLQARGQMPQLELESQWCLYTLWRESAASDREWMEARMTELGVWESVEALGSGLE